MLAKTGVLAVKVAEPHRSTFVFWEAPYYFPVYYPSTTMALGDNIRKDKLIPDREHLAAREQSNGFATGDCAELEAQLAAVSRNFGLIEFAPDGTIRQANEHFLQLMGYSAQ